jgi:hypothetical protein
MAHGDVGFTRLAASYTPPQTFVASGAADPDAIVVREVFDFNLDEGQPPL